MNHSKETVLKTVSELFDLVKEKQSKVDALTLQVAEMKSRLNDAYTDGQSAMYAARQSKVDELQKHKSLQELEINQISHANQQWQLKCSELQKLVDKLIQDLNERGDKAWAVWESSAEMYEQGRADVFWQVANDLEQALNGGGE